MPVHRRAVWRAGILKLKLILFSWSVWEHAKGSKPYSNGPIGTLIAAVAMALVAYLGMFENLNAWIRQLEPGQLGGLFAVFVVLTVALGIYG